MGVVGVDPSDRTMRNLSRELIYRIMFSHPWARYAIDDAYIHVYIHVIHTYAIADAYHTHAYGSVAQQHSVHGLEA